MKEKTRERDEEVKNQQDKKYKKYERQVKEKLILWLKEKHRDWIISKRTMKNIDVLAYHKASDILISFEVKAPVYLLKDYLIIKKEGKLVGWQAYWSRHKNKTSKAKGLPKGDLEVFKELGYETEKHKRLHYPAPDIIYTGIGQSFFNLRYVNRSYLVLPNFFYLSQPFYQIFLDVLFNRCLPLGLIEYEFFLKNQGEKTEELVVKEFKEIYKAKDLFLWKNYIEVLHKRNGIEERKEQAIRSFLKERLLDIEKEESE